MTYTYGLHGAPAVGGGLPGLPQRSSVANAVGQMFVGAEAPSGQWAALDGGLWDARLQGIGILPEFVGAVPPISLPAGLGTGVAFSTDGQYMSVAHDTSPFVTIYKRSGDTFTKLPNPSALPAGTCYGVAFSTDGQYMSVAHVTSPFVTIYYASRSPFISTEEGSTAYVKVE